MAIVRDEMAIASCSHPRRRRKRGMDSFAEARASRAGDAWGERRGVSE